MTAPFSSGVTRNNPAVATASTSTVVVHSVARDGTIGGVMYTPLATVTGANTNTRKLELINKGTDGLGTTVIASLQFDSGTNATAFVPRSLTLSGTAANLNVLSGQVLVLVSSAVGTGLADPGGLVAVSLAAKYA